MLDVSVVIPCHNEERFLGEQLQALAEQDFDGEWEVIVVDNRSSDATADLARGFTALESRIRVLAAHDRASAAYARTVGVTSAMSDRLAFCDADDRVDSGWLSAIEAALRHHQIVAGRVEVDALNDRHLAESRGRRDETQQLFFGEVPVFRSNTGGMTRAAWDRLGGFRDHALEDIELSIRAASLGVPVAFVPEAIVSYRYRDSSEALWRQGVGYGEAFVHLARQARAAGLNPPSWHAGLRSWVWLVARVPLLVSSSRPRWIWTAAVRWGTVRTRASLVDQWTRRRLISR